MLELFCSIAAYELPLYRYIKIPLGPDPGIVSIVRPSDSFYTQPF